MPSAVVLAEPEVLQLPILRRSVDKPYQGSHSLGKAAAGQQECIHTSMPTYVRPLELPRVHRECLSLLNATRNPGMKMQSDLQEVLQVSCCTCSCPTTGWQHGSQLMASVAWDCSPTALKGTVTARAAGKLQSGEGKPAGRDMEPCFTHFFDKDTVCEPLFHSVSHFQGTGKHDTFSHLQVLRCLSQTDPR